MGGDSGRFEYPDEAGYPDGMGVLDEGTEDVADDATGDESSSAERSEETADAAENDLENFAMQDQEDDEGV